MYTKLRGPFQRAVATFLPMTRYILLLVTIRCSNSTSLKAQRKGPRRKGENKTGYSTERGRKRASWLREKSNIEKLRISAPHKHENKLRSVQGERERETEGKRASWIKGKDWKLKKLGASQIQLRSAQREKKTGHNRERGRQGASVMN